MSYALRAGIVEPLAKNGHLRVVVATMGLAAGINFSMRSVLVTDTRYLAGNFEREVQPDELLQMFGRAGRRGLDESGFVLSTPRQPRLHDGRAAPAEAGRFRGLARAHRRDAPGGAARGESLCGRGGIQPPPLHDAAGAAGHRALPGDRADAVRAPRGRGTGAFRPARRDGDAQQPRRMGAAPGAGACTLGEVLVRDGERWRPLLQAVSGLEGIGFGNPVKLRAGRDKIYGRELPLATISPEAPDAGPSGEMAAQAAAETAR